MTLPIRLAAIALIAALPTVASADANTAPEAAGVRDYDTCMALVTDRAEEALEAALAWEHKGGGAGARHCAAMALAALGNFADAADQLEALAWDMPDETPDATRAEILAQAGQFWLDARRPAKADALLSAAIDLAPTEPQIRIDRAVVFAAMGRLQDAIIDLSAAILLDPISVDALVLRASAYRQTGRLAAAEDDLVRALALEPEDGNALLERGLLRRAEGDETRAREAWLAVLKHHRDGPAAAAARQHLRELPSGTRKRR
jgi:tetratricopeptide (TPR) repeat protein